MKPAKIYFSSTADTDLLVTDINNQYNTVCEVIGTNVYSTS